jgi:hypothetical protein
VGYYLVAPCQKGQTWTGKRTALQQMGWGTAVVFIGEQDWPVSARDTAAMASSATTASSASTASNAQPAANTPPQCSSSNLSTEKGAVDAARADSTAAAEGFPAGTVIYLDIERVENVSPKYETYIRAWVRALLQRGRFMPGAYAHEKNANAVRGIVAGEAAKNGMTGEPPMWVASRAPFDVAAAPGSSGFPYARIWQGLFNRSETWGGVTLTIDANVATSADPSSSSSSSNR